MSKVERKVDLSITLQENFFPRTLQAVMARRRKRVPKNHRRGMAVISTLQSLVVKTPPRVQRRRSPSVGMGEERFPWWGKEERSLLVEPLPIFKVFTTEGLEARNPVVADDDEFTLCPPEGDVDAEGSVVDFH